MFGAIVFFPWFIQGVVGVSATRSGTVMMPMTFAMVLGSIIGGCITRYITYRWQTTGGLALVICGFLLATRFNVNTGVWEAFLPIILLGFGLGIVMPLITIGAQQAFGREVRGVVTSTTAFFRSVGSTIGVTVFGIIFNHQMTAQFHKVLAPRLSMLPVPPAGLAKMAEKPSNLVQVLLQKPLQALIPESVRQPFLQMIKVMMSSSITPVFWTAIGTVGVGVLVAQFLGNESLSRQSIRQGSAATAAEIDEPPAPAFGH
jgi:hypothetical protein